MDLNKVMIIGRLTRDPEIRTIPSGDTVANFGVATNRIWTNAQGQKQEAVEYHNIVAWRKLADICGQYLKKGDRVYIEGSLQTRDWEGQDGIKRYRTEIVARDMIMLSPPRTQGGSTYPATPRTTSAPAPVITPSAPPSEIPTINVEEDLTSVQEDIKVASEPEAKPRTQEKKGEEDEGISIEDIPF